MQELKGLEAWQPPKLQEPFFTTRRDFSGTAWYAPAYGVLEIRLNRFFRETDAMFVVPKRTKWICLGEL